MPLEFDTSSDNFAKIKVIGVGGGGNNAINRMIEYGLQGVEFVVINTDKQALYLSSSPYKVQIGEKLTKGLGSGGDPEVGKRAAEESRDELEQVIKGSDLLFIAAGLGGGTGTGAAPIIAQIAREHNILTIAFVTRPFYFEGKPRGQTAEKGYGELANYVDSIVIIPNDKLLSVVGKGTPLMEAFKYADDALRQGIQGITDLIAKPALINLDFADVRAVMLEGGVAHMGIGIGYGENKAVDAAKQAIQSPLLDTTIQGAKGVIFNITGDKTLGLLEIEEAAKLVEQAADPQARIFMGADIDPNLEDEVRITVIATGFESSIPSQQQVKEQRKAIEVKIESVAGNEEAKKEEGKASSILSEQHGAKAGAEGDKVKPEPGVLEMLEEEEPSLDIPIFLKKKPKRVRYDD